MIKFDVIIAIIAHLRSKGSSVTHLCMKPSYGHFSVIIQNNII